jgi:hypothetical protein
MKKIIIAVILIFILGAGTAMADTGEKNPFVAIWKAISNLQDKDNELERKINCLELAKITPDRGPGEWINIDIVGFYQETLRRYNKVKTNPSRPEEQDLEISFYETLIAEAKPLYDEYLEQCE